jgi:Mg-chelatase subunit ChlD
MSDDVVQISARFDRTLVSEGGDSIRYLFVELNAKPASLVWQPAAKSAPLNLAIAIDSSRSMTGSRLKSAIDAAQGIVEGLDEDDFISIVSFSEDAIVHIDGVRCDHSGKRAAHAAIAGIGLRAGTNISEGWFKASECVGTVMLSNRNHKNHVLILSDGHANRGTLQAAALSHHATELQTRGLTASAVGIGDGYSTSQLYAMAQYGGGRIHHAAHSGEIVEVVYGELMELRDRSIENLKVIVRFPGNVAYKSLNIFPVDTTHNIASCILGGLSSGASRNAIFRVNIPDGKRNEELEFKIGCEWRNCGESRMRSNGWHSVSLKFAEPGKNSLQKVDDEAGFHIAKFWQSWVVWQATNLNRAKDYVRLDRFLLNEIKYFRRFCKAFPPASLLLSELQELSRVAHEDWDEASRKEIQTETYTTLYGLRDTRSGTRKKWQDYTGEFTRM